MSWLIHFTNRVSRGLGCMMAPELEGLIVHRQSQDTAGSWPRDCVGRVA